MESECFRGIQNSQAPALIEEPLYYLAQQLYLSHEASSIDRDTPGKSDGETSSDRDSIQSYGC